MLIQAHKNVVNISDNGQINLENYMESLKYVSNLYFFMNNLKEVVPSTDHINFCPSFIGEMASQKLNKKVSQKEMEMKVFILESELFSEDKIIEKVYKVFTPLCDFIDIENENRIKFILK